MHHPTHEVHRKLKAFGPLQIYPSLESAGISLSNLPVTSTQLHEVEAWRKKFGRILIEPSKSGVYKRDTHGPRFIIDDYLAGDPECFRHKVFKKTRTPVHIGVNVSAAYGSWELNAMRGGAILAFIDILRKQGRPYKMEIVYGNGHTVPSINGNVECHVRINLMAFSNTVTHACISTDTISEVGEKCVNKLARKYPTQPHARQRRGWWSGGYRLHEYEELGIQEYDIVLDRIESSDAQVEMKRITDRFKTLGVEVKD